MSLSLNVYQMLSAILSAILFKLFTSLTVSISQYEEKHKLLDNNRYVLIIFFSQVFAFYFLISLTQTKTSSFPC